MPPGRPPHFPGVDQRVMRIWWNIEGRCGRYPTTHKYKYYGGKGVENKLTPPELQVLWERDKAMQMQRPSIDRIDSHQSYIFENCRFIEHKENCRAGGRHMKTTEKKSPTFINLPQSIKEEVQKLAKEETRSFTSQLVHLLKRALAIAVYEKELNK